MTPEQNITLARAVAEKILSMDYFAAQLRLVHSSALRDGEFDQERLRTIVAHLQEVQEISAALIPLAASLTPTLTPAPAPEKEEQ